MPGRGALNNLLDRTDVPELRELVHAVVQADSYGVPISRVLRSQAADQREKRRFRAEERAMKLPVKVIFPLCSASSLWRSSYSVRPTSRSRPGWGSRAAVSARSV